MFLQKAHAEDNDPLQVWHPKEWAAQVNLIATCCKRRPWVSDRGYVDFRKFIFSRHFGEGRPRRRMMCVSDFARCQVPGTIMRPP